MSESQERGRGEQAPQVHPLVEALLRDNAGPTDSRVFAGFLGRGLEEGRWRLYTSVRLDSCLEFDRADLLHSATVDTPFPVSVIWLKSDARVQEITYRKAESAFLQGAIVDEMLPGSENDLLAADALIGTIIRTASRLLCSRICSRICPSNRICPDTGMTFCAPGSCLVCAAPR